MGAHRSLCADQRDAAFDQFRKEQPVDARAQHLHPAQPGRGRKEGAVEAPEDPLRPRRGRQPRIMPGRARKFETLLSRQDLRPVLGRKRGVDHDDRGALLTVTRARAHARIELG